MHRTRREFLKTAGLAGAGLGSVGLTAGCAHPPPQPAQPPGPAALAPSDDLSGAASLGAHAAARGMLYGCAVNANALASDPLYARLVKEQARIVVAENAMKWGRLRPALDAFNFDAADALLAFAEANRQKIRGHNLAWHRQNPAWLESYATTANARKLLTTHIETVVGRYAGRMHSWDVVNEAVFLTDGRPDGLRNSIWLKLIGEDYIELAFQTARDADPQALLAYNDYGIEEETPAAEQKRQTILVMLRRMIARRVPVDAVGIQSHIAALSPSGYGAGLMRFIAEARGLGLQVFLTEMDVNDRALAYPVGARDAAVAAAYRQYLDLVLADPAVRVVLTWGITDRFTWLNGEDSRADRQPERSLPFDSAYRPKAVAFAVREAFDRRALFPNQQ